MPGSEKKKSSSRSRKGSVSRRSRSRTRKTNDYLLVCISEGTNTFPDTNY